MHHLFSVPSGDCNFIWPIPACKNHNIFGCFFLIWESKLCKTASNFHKHKEVLPSEQGISPEPAQSLLNVCPWENTFKFCLSLFSLCYLQCRMLGWRSWVKQMEIFAGSHLAAAPCELGQSHSPWRAEHPNLVKSCRCWFILPVSIPFCPSKPEHPILTSAVSEPCSCRKIKENKKSANTTQHFQWYWKDPLLGQSLFFLRQGGWKWSAAGSSAWFSKETTNQTLQWRLALGSCGCLAAPVFPPPPPCYSSLSWLQQCDPDYLPWVLFQIPSCLQMSPDSDHDACWCPEADPGLEEPKSPEISSRVPAQLPPSQEADLAQNLKAKQNPVQMPRVRKSTNGLPWPAQTLAMLFNCTFVHQIPRRIKKKKQLCILLLRSGSCLPSPVSHSLIKSFLLIQPVPKSLLAIKNLIYYDFNWRVCSDFIYKMFCVISQKAQDQQQTWAQKSALPSPATLKVTLNWKNTLWKSRTIKHI